MLVLSRRIGESVVLPSCDVTIRVVGVAKNRVKLGITAPCEMPVHREEVAARILPAGEPKSSPRVRPGAHVLIADPEPTRLQSYSQSLAEAGLQVSKASTGVECLGRLRGGPADALVLHAALLWGGAAGVLALMCDPRSGLPSLPVLVQGGRLDRVGLNGSRPRRVDLAERLLQPSELVQRVRRLLPVSPAASSPAPPTGCPDALDARLADWITQRTSGRIQGLHVERQVGRVVIHGSTRTYYARQLAQQAAWELLSEPGTGPREELVVNIEVE
jgi:carbon storage regulator